MRVEFEQAILRINQLQDEVEALRGLERQEPIIEERMRGLRDAASQLERVDHLNPFDGVYWGRDDEIQRMQRGYQEDLECQIKRNQELQAYMDNI